MNRSVFVPRSLNKKILIPVLCILYSTFGCCTVFAQPTGEQSKRMRHIIRNHQEAIQAWANNPIVIESVKNQNNKNIGMEQIRKIDQEWVGGEKTDLMLRLQQNDVGKYLKEKVSSNKILYTEAFLCDNKGAVVGEYPTTSDYWQGDEDKFIKSYNGGNGQEWIGPIEFDDSSKTVTVQISIPVKENNQTIGVLIVGLKYFE
jgi:hypothetical protein